MSGSGGRRGAQKWDSLFLFCMFLLHASPPAPLARSLAPSCQLSCLARRSTSNVLGLDAVVYTARTYIPRLFANLQRTCGRARDLRAVSTHPHPVHGNTRYNSTKAWWCACTLRLPLGPSPPLPHPVRSITPSGRLVASRHLPASERVACAVPARSTCRLALWSLFPVSGALWSTLPRSMQPKLACFSPSRVSAGGRGGRDWDWAVRAWNGRERASMDWNGILRTVYGVHRAAWGGGHSVSDGKERRRNAVDRGS